MRNNFSELINKDKYQVFLLYSKAVLPWSFSCHPWLVVNEKGKISRWEIIVGNRPSEQSWGLIAKNFCNPWLGSEIVPLLGRYYWKSKILGKLEGENGSKAHTVAINIMNSGSSYPHKEKYSLLGPNSNTYAQWILDQNPGFPAKLPRNAFGKGYKQKK